MKILEIKNAAGNDVFLNQEALSYVRLDPMNTNLIHLCMNNGDVHTVKGPVETVLKLFK